MNNLDKKLIQLVDYVQYLLNDEYKIYYRLNKGHIKKVNKLLKSFVVEYTKEYWCWKGK